MRNELRLRVWRGSIEIEHNENNNQSVILRVNDTYNG